MNITIKDKIELNCIQNCCTVDCTLTYVGKPDKAGKEISQDCYIWWIPSLDIWFQTRSESDSESIAKILSETYLQTYLENDLDILLKKLHGLGWSTPGAERIELDNIIGNPAPKEALFDKPEAATETQFPIRKNTKVAVRKQAA